MAVPIRCISQHAEEVLLDNGETEMVPVGDISSGAADMGDPNNKRLVEEGKILPLYKKDREALNIEGDDTA